MLFFFLGGRQCSKYEPPTSVLLCEMTTVRGGLHQLVNVHFVSKSNHRMKCLAFVLFMSGRSAPVLTVLAPLKMDVYTISSKIVCLCRSRALWLVLLNVGSAPSCCSCA